MEAGTKSRFEDGSTVVLSPDASQDLRSVHEEPYLKIGYQVRWRAHEVHVKIKSRECEPND